MSTTPDPHQVGGGLLSRLWPIALLGLVGLAAAAGLVWWARQPSSKPIDILPPVSPTAVVLRVDVTGAVRNPGVVRLPANAIVADALVAAGGPTDEADLDRLNKAAALRDGVQIHVPRRGEAVPTALPAAGAVAPGTPAPTTRVNINTASLAELDTLPGVGAVTAQRIIDGRPYSRVEDLLRVRGIGDATLAKLRDLITVE